ncbi:MAG: hypothetical protein HOI47_02310 [Candidatus Scalindua sp.]|nr:hypothetical protein [Candidatus Scalindua sp.]
MVATITDDRKRINRKHRDRDIAIKKKDTNQQREAMDKLYCRACRAVDMVTLNSVRRDKLTKILIQKNYADFIRVVDRLMESF